MVRIVNVIKDNTHKNLDCFSTIMGYWRRSRIYAREALRYAVVFVSTQHEICRVSQRREVWGAWYRALNALGILASDGKNRSRGLEPNERRTIYAKECLVPPVPKARRKTPWE
jgi:hypothetical protein